MIKILLIVLLSFIFCVDSLYAKAAYELSDAELDQISAEGFDINMESALAFRQAVGINQDNLAAVSAAVNSGTIINNYNSALVNAVSGSAIVNQRNIAAVVAREGNIEGAVLNNQNHADITSIGSAEANQNNIAALVALNGGVLNSAINNLNYADINSLVGSVSLNQQNIAIIISSGQLTNNAIQNINMANAAGNSVAINAANSIAQSFSFSQNGFSGIITINNDLIGVSSVSGN